MTVPGAPTAYTGMPPLDACLNALDSADRRQPLLILEKNATRRAKWDCKLGFQSTGRFPVPLSTLQYGGGDVGHLKLKILRVFPLQFMEKLRGSGNEVVRDVVGEEIASSIYRRECEMKRQEQRERSLKELESDGSRRGRGGEGRRRSPRQRSSSSSSSSSSSNDTREEMILAQIDDSQTRRDIKRNLDSSNTLSDSQLEQLEKAKGKIQSLEESRRWEKSSSGDRGGRGGGERDGGDFDDSEFGPRDIKPFVRLMVTDFSTSGSSAAPFISELVVWNVSQSQREALMEGSTMIATGLSIGYKSRHLENTTIRGYQPAEVALRTDKKMSNWHILPSSTTTTTTTTMTTSATATDVDEGRIIHDSLLSLSSCVVGEMVDVIGLVLQVPAMSSSGTTIKASATTNTAIAWLGDASGEMVDIHIPHTGNKSDVTVSTAIYVEDSYCYCCNDDFLITFFCCFCFFAFFLSSHPRPSPFPHSLQPISKRCKHVLVLG